MNYERRVERLKLKVEDLKEKRGAVILAHNYQSPGVQDVSDFVGDSLELAMRAMNTDAKVIVFAGVSFSCIWWSCILPKRPFSEKRDSSKNN